MNAPAVWLPSLLVAGVLFAITRIRYVIDDRYVRVVWWRISLRKIALTDIEEVNTSCPIWNEHWCNTLWPVSRRVVHIRRKTGWVRSFIITPENRDAFVAELRDRLRR